jgi:voltage-gated potassium channel Kch
MRVLIRHYRAVGRTIIEEPELRLLAGAALTVLASGTFAYHFIEGWGLLDSLYFTTVTLATIGYGDLAPRTDAGKAFTVLYVLLGIGIVGGFLTVLARAPYLRGSLPANPGRQGHSPPDHPEQT